MTPQEVDGIYDSVQGYLCILCATVLGLSTPSLCPDCALHVSTHQYGLDREPMAEKFLMLLGLTKGCQKFAHIEFKDEVIRDELYTDRMLKVTAMMYALRDHSEERQMMLWDRYCALYIPHTAAFLAACQGTGPLVSFESFMWILNELRVKPFWARFLLSDEPLAASGNHLAVVVAEQLVLHGAKWERQVDVTSRPRVVFAFMSNACFVLGHLISVQVDKPNAVRLPQELHEQVQGLLLDGWRSGPPCLRSFSTVFAWDS